MPPILRVPAKKIPLFSFLKKRCKRNHVAVSGVSLQANCFTFDHVSPALLSISCGPGDEGRYPGGEWWFYRGCPCSLTGHVCSCCTPAAGPLLCSCQALGRPCRTHSSISQAIIPWHAAAGPSDVPHGNLR